MAFPAVNVVNAEDTCNMQLGGRDGQCFPSKPRCCGFWGALEDNDGEGFSNTQSLWIQVVEPALCRSRLALIGSRFYCSILRLRRSFEVSIGFVASVWIQVVEPALCQSRLALIGSRFYCSILRLRRSFEESIGFVEASCPSQWSSRTSLFVCTLLTTGLGSDAFPLLVVSPKLNVPQA